MKNTIRLVIVFIIFSTFIFFNEALASDDVVIDIVSVNPSELSGDGTVNISFELSNHSENDLTSLSISLGDAVFDFSGSRAIPTSGSAILPIALPLKSSQLDNPLVFTIRWIAGGEPYYATAETTVVRTIDPTITLTREVSTKHARTGQQVTVSYTLKNSTKFDMTEVTLIDEQISSEPIRKNDVLRANGNFSIDYPFIMGTTDVESRPVVTYVVNERTKSFSNIKPVTVVYSDIAVEIEVEKKNTDLNGTEFEITLKNTGASDVFNIVVSDSDGFAVNSEPVDLKTGESKSFVYLAPPLTSNQSKQISFSYSGKDSFGDELETKNSETFLINPFYDDSQFSAYLTVEVLTPPSHDNNTAEIAFSIENKSLLPLTDVRIAEEALGQIAQIDFLPSGVTDLIQWISFEDNSDMTFVLEGRDTSGSNHQLGSVILSNEILYADSTPEINTTPEPSDDLYTVDKPSLWGNFIFRILVVLGAVMILSCAVLLALKVLDVGKEEVIDEVDIDNFFGMETEDIMINNDLEESNTNYSSSIPLEYNDTYDHGTKLFDGKVPKHIEIKKRPAKKIKTRSKTRRIG